MGTSGDAHFLITYNVGFECKNKMQCNVIKCSYNFAEGHLKVEGLRESHLMPVPRQSYTRLISPQQKTNLALANEFDLHASDWCFHFHTIWIRLFKEITTFLPWFGVILLDYPTLNTTFFFCLGKKKSMCLWEFLIQVRYQIHLEKANELSNSSLLFSWQITYSLTPGVFILRNIRDGQRQWLFALQDSGSCTKIHFLNMSQHLKKCCTCSTGSGVSHPHAHKCISMDGCLQLNKFHL